MDMKELGERLEHYVIVCDEDGFNPDISYIYQEGANKKESVEFSRDELLHMARFLRTAETKQEIEHETNDEDITVNVTVKRGR